MELSSKTKEGGEKAAIELKKDIGILKGVGIVVGVIVGSGIFLSPVGVLRSTHSVGLSLVMWVVAGLFSALGAIVYAELGVTMPRSGGEYVYILETFGPFLAFMALWITFFVIGTVSCAVNSLVLAKYLLKPFFPTCDIPESAVQIVAVLGLLTLCFINCYRVSWATKLSVVFTAGKVLALLLIIGFGCASLARGNVGSFVDPFEDSATSPGDLASAFYQGFWSFAGWNYLNFLTGEMKNPARNLPIVIVLSLVLVTVIYLLANVAYLTVLTPFEILNADAVAVLLANRCLGVMAWIMPVFVGASVFGSINGEVLSMSRLCFTGSEEGHMPSVLSMVSVTNLTPIPSVLAVIILSIIFQFSPDLYVLIEFTGLAFTVVSGIAVCSLLHIKRTNPEMNTSSFKLPIFLPILYLIVNFSIGAFAIYNGPKNALICFGLMAIGIPLYLLGVSWTKKPRVVVNTLYNFTVLMQKTFNVVPQEAVPEVMPISPEENNRTVEPKQVWIPSLTP